MHLPPADDYGALEPHISGQIMELHHSKHHQTYVNGLNSALETLGDAEAKGDSSKAASVAPLLNFHGGGHVNHTLFWENLAPANKDGGGEPEGELKVRAELKLRAPGASPKCAIGLHKSSKIDVRRANRKPSSATSAPTPPSSSRPTPPSPASRAAAGPGSPRTRRLAP